MPVRPQECVSVCIEEKGVTPHHRAEEVSSAAQAVVLRKVRALFFTWGMASGRLPERGGISTRCERTERWRKGKEGPPGWENSQASPWRWSWGQASGLRAT